MLNNEEPTELLNQGARAGKEVIDNLEAENPTEIGGGIENMDAADDDAETVKAYYVVNEEARPDNEGIENMEAEVDAETVKVAENMWSQLLEKIVTEYELTEPLAPDKTGHVDVVGPKQVDQSRGTLEKDTRTIKPSRKKTDVGKKAARGIIIREPVVGNEDGATGASAKDNSKDAVESAKTKAVVPDKGKKVANVPEIGRVGKRRKDEVGIAKEKKPKRTKNVRVESMGFGGLLEFNVAETPSTLGYWLLENFDPMAGVIKLRDGRELRVEVDDVTHVLGIPNGRTVIKRKAKNLPHPVVTEFKSSFTNHSANITAYLVGDELLTRDADSIWFKRIFLILITTCLVECCGNGYVISRIIPNFEDPDRAQELSWGPYIKKCLAEEVIDWRQKKNKPEAFFTGPLMFLMVVMQTLLGSLGKSSTLLNN
ncbi:hypothetical protein CASFOL_029160 [Castilleja foliolosa]|uniref:Uncharacterized protein n=1 Tax=Castilleja foliolosa TaxID=1961234 RepID=A0ABD3CBK7_9LAMI